MKTVYALIISILSVALLTGCGGGGGGGDDFIGAARLGVSLNPSVIDTGDHVKVSVHVSNVHEDGIALKVRYASGLNYVLGTAFLSVDEHEIDVGPKVNAVSTADEYTYLVFYFTQSMFGEDEEGTLEFELEGTGEILDGRLEVDADVDDPLIDNDTEFNIEAPEFLAEDEAKIEVRD